MKLKIMKIDKIIFEGEVSKIKALSSFGYFEILEGHAPMIALLKAGDFFCEEKFENHFRPQTFNLSGGIMRIEPKEIVVLAE